MLPFLLGERLVARVDLKSDRKRETLQVRGGSAEADVDVQEVIEPLALSLNELTLWLGLGSFEVTSRRGELMRGLRAFSRQS